MSDMATCVADFYEKLMEESEAAKNKSNEIKRAINEHITQWLEIAAEIATQKCLALETVEGDSRSTAENKLPKPEQRMKWDMVLPFADDCPSA
jgi:hypothetical protein